MQKVNVIQLVIEAQKQLIKKPFDLAHDITHHYRVYESCLRIIDEEKLRVDSDFVGVCAWLHDIGGRRGENIQLIQNLLQKYIDNLEYIEKVIKIIKEHSFGETQTQIESKILFDADKLEYVNPFRLKWFLKAYDEGHITEGVYLQYKKEWKERIKDVEEQLHFSYSKRQFARMLPTTTEIMKNINTF